MRSGQARSATRPALREARFGQQRIRCFAQTEARQALTEFRELDGELGARPHTVRTLGALSLLSCTDDRSRGWSIVQRFAGHPSSTSARSSVGLRGCPGSSSRLTPQIQATELGENSSVIDYQVVTLQSVTARHQGGCRRPGSPGRCWETTATTARLPQSARCPVTWHSNIQTVAPLQRSGAGAGGTTIAKWL